MSQTNKKKLSPGWVGVIIVLLIVDFVALIRYLLQGKNIALFNPKGLIAEEQYSLMLFIIIFMSAIAVPVITFLFFTVWKYRDTNSKTKVVDNTNNSHHIKYMVFGMWLIPIVIILSLASVMWPATHRLSPQKQIAADAKPITIQVVALRWKWLFIYPEQKIATVNFVQIPVNTPVTFELTADESPMSSFWIPNLGGQLYAMTGHVNQLNLIADTPGDYPGMSAEINGKGFAGMKFTARASQASDFDEWVQEVQGSSEVLNTEMYEKLVKPSENNPVSVYSAYENNLYDNVVMKYAGTAEGDMQH